MDPVRGVSDGAHARKAVAALLACAVLWTWQAAPAAAEPATDVAYPGGASATPYDGLAFDTCAAPSLATMRAWLASPYRAIGVYVSGVNRSCRQTNLTADWVANVTRDGWRLLPITVGRQAPCINRRGLALIDPAVAAQQGRDTAAEAIAAAAALGMAPGTALYVDIEGYPAGRSSCTAAVRDFVSGWTSHLHSNGWLAGVYGDGPSLAADLVGSYSSTRRARPDAFWLARWDGVAATTGWSGVPASAWAVRQRVKQFRGDHSESYGGIGLVIDSNVVSAPVATVPLGYPVTVQTSLRTRSGPSTTAAPVGRVRAGASVTVVCQTTGDTVGTGGEATRVWNRLADGSFVTDRYVATPNRTGFSQPLPQCTYPAQVTASSLNRREQPTSGSARLGTLPAGALSWTRCQVGGAVVAGSSTWNRLDEGVGGGHVSAFYVAGASSIPACVG